MLTARSEASFMEDTTFQRVSASCMFTPRADLRARGLLVLGERQVDRARLARHLPLHEREVGLLHRLAVGEDLGEPHHRLAVLRDEHDSRGVAIEPVRGRGLELGGRQVVRSAEVRARHLDERRAGDAGAGMRREPGRLVHREHVGVLVEDAERHRNARGAAPRRLGPREEPLLVAADDDRVAGRDHLLRLPARAVHADLPGAEHLVDVRERHVAERLANELVEPLAGGVL